jgi:thiol-disulfide isomerase/thioredoxin
MSLGKQFSQSWSVFKIKSQEDSSFASLVAEAQAEGKFFVVDFWTTKCVRCPAALDRLNNEAETMSDKAIFVSCALSQGDGNKEIVSDLVDG